MIQLTRLFRFKYVSDPGTIVLQHTGEQEYIKSDIAVYRLLQPLLLSTQTYTIKDNNEVEDKLSRLEDVLVGWLVGGWMDKSSLLYYFISREKERRSQP